MQNQAEFIWRAARILCPFLGPLYKKDNSKLVHVQKRVTEVARGPFSCDFIGAACLRRKGLNAEFSIAQHKHTALQQIKETYFLCQLHELWDSFLVIALGLRSVKLHFKFRIGLGWVKITLLPPPTGECSEGPFPLQVSKTIKIFLYLRCRYSWCI